MNADAILFVEHDEVMELSDSPHCGTCMPEVADHAGCGACSTDAVEVTDAPHCGGCF